MAAAFVQENYEAAPASAATISITGAGYVAPATGHHVIIVVLNGTVSAGGGVSSCADDVGNTYNVDANTNSSGTVTGAAILSGYIDPANGAPGTITVTMSKAMTTGVRVEEWSGLPTTAFFDKATIAAGTATTGQTSASVTPIGAGELAIMAAIEQGTVTTWATGNIGTQASSDCGPVQGGGASRLIGCEYVLACDAGAQTGAGTWASAPGSANNTKNILAFYKVAAAAKSDTISDRRTRRRVVYR
jgi:hypothetical protein